MTGYVMAFSPCVCCQNIFGYNPHRVPSTSAFTGTREPVCSDCMDKINTKRATLGLPAFPVNADAYEAIDETEL